MQDPEVLAKMRADWNQRAGEDAYYYVAFGRREQGDDEFFASAADVVRGLSFDFKRLPARDAALEIGCGPGRIMRPLASHFAEIHGVDVSDEMIRLAKERLRDTPNAHPHHTSGSDLSQFPGGKFDLVYSYAVFQHIPSRDVVLNYLAEGCRVLKTGGILKCQVNGLPPHARQYDTWSGVRLAPEEMHRFAREHDLQLLALEGIWTQYMWITARKMPAGWARSLEAMVGQAATCPASVRNVSNEHTGEAVVPAGGPLAAMSLWIENLPAGCDLNHLEVTADGRACRLSYLGEPERDGVSQLNAALPENTRTGLVPVAIHWLGRPVCARAWVRVMPAGPAVPRIWTVTDGINLLSDHRIVTGTVKVTMSEVERPGEFNATIGGRPVREIDHFCADPLALRYEFNFKLPEATPPGAHAVEMALGKRRFAPMPVEVA